MQHSNKTAQLCCILGNRFMQQCCIVHDELKVGEVTHVEAKSTSGKRFREILDPNNIQIPVPKRGATSFETNVIYWLKSWA